MKKKRKPSGKNKHRYNPETGKYFCLKCNIEVDLSHFKQVAYGVKEDGTPKRINLMCISSNKSVNPDLKWGYKTDEYRRNQWLKDIYGIDLEIYNKIFDSQNGCCAICGIHQSKLSKPLSVDHCHTTGKIRGLLCHKCNGGLGMLGDTVEGVEKAFNYLKNNG